MHASVPPDEEAALLYVDQSSLLARHLAAPALEAPAQGGDAGGIGGVGDPARSVRPLVIWDVGLGAGHNAMALVHRLDQHRGHAPVHLVSFEKDLDAFLLALGHQKLFAHLRHEAPHRLARAGVFVRPGLTWTLCQGDFLDELAGQEPADLVFYDPFSSKVDTELWTPAAFARLFSRVRQPCELFTYSSSTAARAALLAAGFHVAAGAPSGGRLETTIALRPGAAGELAAHRLLGQAWLGRWSRSSARHPSGASVEEQRALDERVAQHPQFQ